MTWSSRSPRAVPLNPSLTSGAVPLAWSPDELALTTRTSIPLGATRRDGAGSVREQEDAYARGYDDGELVGRTTERARLQTAVAALEDALAAVNAHATRWTANAEENVCALSIAVARRLIGRELQADGSLVLDAVREALAEFPLDQPLTVRLNPLDLQHLMDGAPVEGDRSITSRADTRWLADARIEAGGFLLEGAERVVDGRIDVGLERLYSRLTNVGH